MLIDLYVNPKHFIERQNPFSNAEAENEIFLIN